ncbi:MAG: MarR family winged helix-turn-helix transcriptional regulator [Actinomycetes bacterium]
MPSAPRARSRADLPFALRIAVTNAWVSQLFDQELTKKGVAPFQAGVLMMVRLLEPVTPTGLEAEMGLASTTLRDRLRELAAAGLLERIPNADDRRSYFLQTTAAGGDVVRVAMATSRRVARLLEKQGSGPLDEMCLALDDVRTAARQLIEGDLGSGPASRSTGPW